MRKIISLLFVLLLTGCTTIAPVATPTPTSEASKPGCDISVDCDVVGEKADMTAYKDFMDTDHVYREITMAEGNQLLESDKTFVLYYGFSTCPWCIEVLPILNDVAKEYGMNVEYINVRPEGTDSSNDIRVDSNPDYVKTVELTSEFLSVNDEGAKRLYVPFVFFVKDGTIVAAHEATFPEHDAHERKMTEEEVQRLTKIYQEGFEKLKK